MDRRSLVLGAAALASAAALPRQARARAERDLGRAFDAFVAATGFTGVFLHRAADGAQWARAAGAAIDTPLTANRLQTRFAIGSVSKFLSSAIVLRLVDRGALSLDAPIGTYLPELPAAVGDHVRLPHLMSNSSGIPDALLEATKADPSLRDTDADAASIVARFVHGPLDFEPGSGFAYIIINWVVVRMILERVGKMPLPALAARELFGPLAMPDSGIAERPFTEFADLAWGYSGTPPTSPHPARVPGFAACTGTYFATAADMANAMQGILTPGYLSEESRRQLLTVRVAKEDYALGGRVTTIGGQRCARETGRIGGYRAHVVRGLDSGETFVLLGNRGLEQSVLADFVEPLMGAGS